MHLPTPQFARLVTLLAFDLTNPELDSMILAWDHIATRYLNKITANRIVSDKVEAIRWLAIHDAVNAIFDSGNGYLFNKSSSGISLAAALAATAQASHDILHEVLEKTADHANLADELTESLAFITDEQELAAGVVTGAASAAAYLQTYGHPALASPLAAIQSNCSHDSRHVLWLAKNRHWRFNWQLSA